MSNSVARASWLRFQLSDLLLAMTASAIGLFATLHETWPVGMMTVVLVWLVIRLAAYPGALLALVIWAAMRPATFLHSGDLVSATIAAALMGAMVHCLVFRQWLAGLIAAAALVLAGAWILLVTG